MVRKSLFARIFSRSKASGGGGVSGGGRVAVAEPSSRLATATKNGSRLGGAMPTASGEKPAAPDAERVQVERVAPADLEPKERKDVKPAKIGPQEELTLKINEGIDNLSGLLIRIDDKLATQNRQRELLTRRLERLPDVMEAVARTQKDNLEATRDVGKAVQEQSKALAGTTESLRRVPEAVDGLGARLDEHARAGTLVKESVETVGRSVRSLADGTQRAQNTLLAEFRRAQDEHRRRLEELVERERRVYYAVAVLGIAVVVSLIVVIARLQA